MTTTTTTTTRTTTTTGRRGPFLRIAAAAVAVLAASRCSTASAGQPRAPVLASADEAAANVVVPENDQGQGQPQQPPKPQPQCANPEGGPSSNGTCTPPPTSSDEETAAAAAAAAAAGTNATAAAMTFRSQYMGLLNPERDTRNVEKEWDVVTVTDDEYFWIGRPEDEPLVDALIALGRKATRVSIQNKYFNFHSAKMIVVRSAWGKYNYLDDYLRFLDDMDRDPTVTMFNPHKLIRWHSNKNVYLKALSQVEGIRFPETVWIRRDTPTIPNLKRILRQLQCKDKKMVIKPATGNAGGGIKMVKPSNMVEMQEHLFFLIRGYHHGDLDDEEEEDFEDEGRYMHEDADDVLIQCYQHQIKTKCERGVIFVGGEVTHGIMKCPAEDNFLVHEGYGGTSRMYQPAPEEIAFAHRVVGAVHDLIGVMPAYLRVDLMYDNDDELTLMELAAGTAALWFKQKPEAAQVLARYLDNVLKEKEGAASADATSLPAATAAETTGSEQEEGPKGPLGSRISVWWKADRQYFPGRVIKLKSECIDEIVPVDPTASTTKIQHKCGEYWFVAYDDEDIAEWIDPKEDKYYFEE